MLVSSQRQTYFCFSIPLEETLDGQLKYSQCLIYENNTNEKIPCPNGWVYDTDITHSVVSEVSFNLLTNDRQVNCFLSLAKNSFG